MTSILKGETEYRPHPAISQSEIILLEEDPLLYWEKKHGAGLSSKTSSGFWFGSLLDTFLLTPDELYTRYIKRPDGIASPSTDLEKAFCDGIRKGLDIVEAQTFAGYKRLSEKQGESLYNKYEKYFEFVDASDGYIEISQADLDKCERCKDSILKHPLAGRLLLGENVERANQVAIKFELGGFPTKALLDTVVMDHDAKKTYLIDLKTTAKSITEFPKWARIYNYPFQQKWYEVGFLRACSENLLTSMSPFFTRAQPYPITNLIIAVESTPRHRTRVFEFSHEMQLEQLNRAKSLIKRLKWHEANDKWHYSMEEYEGELVHDIHTFKRY